MRTYQYIFILLYCVDISFIYVNRLGGLILCLYVFIHLHFIYPFSPCCVYHHLLIYPSRKAHDECLASLSCVAVCIVWEYQTISGRKGHLIGVTCRLLQHRLLVNERKKGRRYGSPSSRELVLITWARPHRLTSPFSTTLKIYGAVNYEWCSWRRRDLEAHSFIAVTADWLWRAIGIISSEARKEKERNTHKKQRRWKKGERTEWSLTVQLHALLDRRG